MTNDAQWRTGEAPTAIILAGGERKRLRALTRRSVLGEAPLTVAAELQRRGGLWNSFVIVAQPAALLRLIESAVPALLAAFEPARARMGTPWEDTAVSKDVLERRPAMLAVLPVHGIGWNDLDEPARVAATQRKLQWQPASA